MHINTAVSHFGSRAAIAQALGERPGISAVYQWRHAVPLAAARRLEEISNGSLHVVDEMYDVLGRVVHPGGLRPKKKEKQKKKRVRKRAA